MRDNKAVVIYGNNQYGSYNYQTSLNTTKNN